jgi:hypothetical protein
LQLTTLKVIQKCALAFLSSQETFFSRNLKNEIMSFLGGCNVETASLPGLSCSKAAGFEGGLFQKIFKGYIFCFLGHLVGEKIFEQFARETNLKKKRSVRQWVSGTSTIKDSYTTNLIL